MDSKRLQRLRIDPIEQQPGVPTAQRLFHDVLRLSELVNQWAEDSHYVDGSGRPKVLPITGGDDAFSGLVNRHFGARPVVEIIELGCKTRVLERVGDNRVAQLSACVIVAGHPTLVLAHVVYSVRSFLATARRNALATTVDCILPDRKAGTVVYAEELADFIAAMRRPTSNLVEIGNRWLTARAAKKHPGRKKRVLLGIHAYVFQDVIAERSAIKHHR